MGLKTNIGRFMGLDLSFKDKLCLGKSAGHSGLSQTKEDTGAF